MKVWSPNYKATLEYEGETYEVEVRKPTWEECQTMMDKKTSDFDVFKRFTLSFETLTAEQIQNPEKIPGFRPMASYVAQMILNCCLQGSEIKNVSASSTV